MHTPKIGRRALLAAGLLAAAPLPALAAGAKPRVVIQTDHGTIVVELEDKKAPITSANFLRYVDARKYDGGTFYRASRTKGVKGAGSIQGGPPDRARRFAPIAHESTRQTGIKHRAGTISMARNAPGSATCDFFIHLTWPSKKTMLLPSLCRSAKLIHLFPSSEQPVPAPEDMFRPPGGG